MFITKYIHLLRSYISVMSSSNGQSQRKKEGRELQYQYKKWSFLQQYSGYMLQIVSISMSLTSGSLFKRIMDGPLTGLAPLPRPRRSLIIDMALLSNKSWLGWISSDFFKRSMDTPARFCNTKKIDINASLLSHFSKSRIYVRKIEFQVLGVLSFRVFKFSCFQVFVFSSFRFF